MDADALRNSVLSKLTEKKSPEAKQPTEDKAQNVSLLEACLTNRAEVLGKDEEIDKETRNKILESVDLKLIGAMMR
jgi:hypothetical protein